MNPTDRTSCLAPYQCQSTEQLNPRNTLGVPEFTLQLNISPFTVPLVSLFCTSGDVYPWFQSRGRSLTSMLHHLHAMDSADSPLTWYLLSSWWPAWQPSLIWSTHLYTFHSACRHADPRNTLKVAEQCTFFRKGFEEHQSFLGPLLPLFWTSCDVCPGFQSQGATPADPSASIMASGALHLTDEHYKTLKNCGVVCLFMEGVFIFVESTTKCHCFPIALHSRCHKKWHVSWWVHKGECT